MPLSENSADILCPRYWRKDIQELVEKGVITGTGGGKLGLTYSDCKSAVIAKRIKEKLN